MLVFPVQTESSGQASLAELFKKSADEWECKSCWVRNKASASECVACTAKNPAGASQAAGTTSEAGISYQSFSVAECSGV
jgi:Zn-finger in Ran binding protein and others